MRCINFCGRLCGAWRGRRPSSVNEPPEEAPLPPAVFGVSESWKRACPTANFLVKYSKRDTGNALDGDEALELTAANYGRDEWWVLLELEAVL